MSPFRRLLLLSGALSPLMRLPAAAAADPEGAPSVLVQRFYDELLAVMKEAKRLSFDERYNRLAPSIGRAFDLPLMTRIAIGPSWVQIAAELRHGAAAEPGTNFYEDPSKATPTQADVAPPPPASPRP